MTSITGHTILVRSYIQEKIKLVAVTVGELVLYCQYLNDTV